MLCILSSGCSDSGPTEPVVPEDTTPPVISNYSEDVTYNEANLSWETDEEARIEVDYSGDSKPEISDSAYRKTHSAHITDLEPEKTYNIIIKAYDKSGNVTEKKISFTTPEPPDTTAPTISNLTLEISEDGAEDPFIKIKYVTDEPSVDSIYVENAGKIYPLGETTSKTAHSFTFSDPAADSVNIKLVAIDEAGNKTYKDTSAVADAAKRYGLIVDLLDDWGREDMKAFKAFLEDWGYRVDYMMGDANTTPSATEIVDEITKIKDKTDSNDEIVFSINTHSGGTRGEVYKLKIAGGFFDPKDILDNFNGDDFNSLKFFPLTCSSKAVIDRISTPNSVSLGPAWDDEYIAQAFFYNTGHGAPIGIIPEVTENPNITVAELFEEVYSDFSALTQVNVQYHPFLGIKGDPAEPPGQYQAWSDKDGNIYGYSEWLDRRAFRIPELKEE